MRRPWWGPEPDDVERALLDLVDDLAADRLAALRDERTPSADARARRELAEVGLWTLGGDEAAGGGGAPRPTLLVVLARLAGTWPALAWSMLQAHVVARCLAADHALHEQLSQGAPCSVRRVEDDLAVPATDVSVTLDRLDSVADEAPLLLLGDGGGVLVPAAALTRGPDRRRTGLDGLTTSSATAEVRPAPGDVVNGTSVARGGLLLDLGVAAIAAGVAEAAAQRALGYSRDREQFGAPLVHLPGVRQSLTRQAGNARSQLVAAVRGNEDGILAAAAVAPAVDAAVDVVAAALQSHGGYGYMTEYAVEGMLRDLVSLRAVSGAAERGRAAGLQLTGAPA